MKTHGDLIRNLDDFRSHFNQTIDVTAELSEEGRRRIVAEVVSTRSYPALQALVRRDLGALSGEVAAYALLQAANLRGTVDLEAMMDLGVDQATALMDAQEYVRERMRL